MDRIDHRIGRSIGILGQVIHEVCQHHVLEDASAGDMSINQLKILKIAGQRSDCTVADVAKLLRISRAAASKNVERLVCMKMVARQRLPEDRRRFYLELRPNGRKFLDRYDRISDRNTTRLMDHFDPAEKELLLDLVDRVIRYTLADERAAEMVCLQCTGRCVDDCVITVSQGSCHALKEVGEHVQPS